MSKPPKVGTVEKGEKPSGVSAIVVGRRTGQMLSDLASPATATLLPRQTRAPVFFLATLAAMYSLAFGKEIQ